jgi:hypothetical protein
MPKGTRVAKCVARVRAQNRGKPKSQRVNPYAVCQAATGQSYATGKKTRR